MKTTHITLIGWLLVAATSTWAQSRAAVATPPPIEPSQLFTIPTGQVVRSMDIDASAASVLFGEKTVVPVRAALGLGDIAEMQIGTLELTSDLASPNRLVSVPAGGLKVYLPLWRYAHGIAASFRRSGTFAERGNGHDYEGKIGEFYTVLSGANFPIGANNSHGWNGIKIKSHLGAKYTDANLTGAETHKRSAWRPVGGFEVWRSNARARILAELSWATNFTNDGHIEDTRVLIGGVRYFFSKHVTFDIGVRHQGNYGGLAESTIQTRLHMAIPTHALRDRVIGI